MCGKTEANGVERKSEREFCEQKNDERILSTWKNETIAEQIGSERPKGKREGQIDGTEEYEGGENCLTGLNNTWRGTLDHVTILFAIT